MDLIKLLINSKGNQTCLLCYTQNDSATNIYSDFEIENMYFSTNIKLEDMIKYLFPEFDIVEAQACEICTQLIIKMYINIRKNIIVKSALLSLIHNLNLELDKSKQNMVVTKQCYLNIDKLTLEPMRETTNLINKSIDNADNYEITNSSIDIQCKECFKTLDSIKTYKLHVKTHKRKGNKTCYSCNYCDYKTLNKSSLQGHINKNHLKVRQFVCNICFKSFYHKKNLTEHELSHSKGRNEICEVCGDTFLHRKNLLEHLRLHNGIKPYECDICSKKFVTSGRRLDHVKRTHTEKSVACLLCDKKFSLNKELTRHMKTVHSISLITIPCYCLSYNNAAQKMRADNIEGIERGRRDARSGLNDEHKGIEKLVGVIASKDGEDAQDDGLTVQEDPVLNLKHKKSSSEQVLLKGEDNVSEKKKLHDVNTQDNSKGQDLDDKKLKSEEHDAKEHENVDKLHFSGETSELKENVDKINSDVESSTKCTTDREITIGSYKPLDDTQTDEHDDNHGKDDGQDHGKGDDKDHGKGDDEDHSKGDDDSEDENLNDIDGGSEKKVSKVYKGPKPAKAPDHYIDDM